MISSWPVGDRINTHLEKLFPEMGVPEVLDFVIRPAWKMRGDRRPPAGKNNTLATYIYSLVHVTYLHLSVVN